MKVTAVKTYLLKHPMSRPTGTSGHYYRVRQTLLVKIETDAGLAGWGETAALGGVRAVIDEQHAPLLVGRDPMQRRRLSRDLWGPNFGSGFAVGAVDMALDDIRGKALHLPVAELYGGRLRDRVPAYASAMNYIEGEDPLRQYPQEARALAERGFKAMKMRLGGQSFERDAATAAAVREAVGPGIRLMADGNGAYTLGGAVRMGRDLERLGYHWFEEPLPQSVPEYAGYESLAATLDISIAACEGLTTRGMFREAIERRAMDIVQPDVSLCGGIGECLFVAELARLHGISCVPHCWGGALAIAATTHLLSLLPDASWARETETPMLELDLVESPFRERLLAEPLDIRDGSIAVPTGPGLGVTIDEKRVAEYAA